MKENIFFELLSFFDGIGYTKLRHYMDNNQVDIEKMSVLLLMYSSFYFACLMLRVSKTIDDEFSFENNPTALVYSFSFGILCPIYFLTEKPDWILIVLSILFILSGFTMFLAIPISLIALWFQPIGLIADLIVNTIKNK